MTATCDSSPAAPRHPAPAALPAPSPSTSPPTSHPASPSARDRRDAAEPRVARVVAQHRGRWLVAPDDAPGERPRPAILAGAFRHASADAAEAHPVVGDRVVLAPAPPGAADPPGAPGAAGAIARSRGVLPRRGTIRRRAASSETRAQLLAANVDVVLVTTPLGEPLNARRVERYATVAWDGGAVPVLVLTKSDACADPAGAVAAARAAVPGVDVVAVSAHTGDGLAALAAWLAPGRCAVLLGGSGAGKSTLANRLLGEARLRTGAVRADGAGRHTTIHRELVVLPGGALLVDTPGLRELGVWKGGDDPGAAALEATFADVAALADACRFADCAHEAEPGCAVRAAVGDGRLAAGRLAAWHRLVRELAHLARRQEPRAVARRQAHDRAMARALRAVVRTKRGG